jgi:dienelactone hydrolase
MSFAPFVRVMKILPIFLSCLSMVGSLSAGLVERLVSYEQGGATLEGFHVYDDAVSGKRPAVLVVHQWTGLSDYERRRSRMLAEMGYNVFAADVYGKGVRPQAPEAGKEAGKYKADRKLFRDRLMAALEVLKADERTHPEKIAAIGYCFGGGGVLEMARAGMNLRGVVSFHGSLDAAAGMEATKGQIPAKVLVLHGAADPFAPAGQVAALQKELTDAGADWQTVLYSGAVHSFTHKEAGDDPSKGAAYQEAADRRSWKAMQLFFSELFQ